MFSLHFECQCGYVWLFVCLGVTVSCATVPYFVNTQEWGLHILFNNIGIDLTYHLNTDIMRD